MLAVPREEVRQCWLDPVDWSIPVSSLSYIYTGPSLTHGCCHLTGALMRRMSGKSSQSLLSSVCHKYPSENQKILIKDKLQQNYFL